MSNFKNLIKARQYKERSQPKGRERFGLLEKKKDYVLRAKDYHRKERRIQAMRVKAALRNPDEFYFQMQSSKTDKDGLHKIINDEKFTNDELAVMRSQDVNYLAAQVQSEKKKIDKLQSGLHLLEAKKPYTHTIFLDDEDDRPEGGKQKKKRKLNSGASAVDSFDPASYFDTTPEALSKAHNRPRLLDSDQAGQSAPAATTKKGRAKAKEVARAKRRLARETASQYEELEARKDRVHKLERAAKVLQLQKQLAAKGRKSKVVDKKQSANGVPVYKWKAIRKK